MIFLDNKSGTQNKAPNSGGLYNPQIFAIHSRSVFMVIREEIEINAPLNVVWRIFSQMEDWDSW
ncbi:MAG: hypothetical protein AB8I58_14590, partial [Anaerolineales bacterium]